VAVADYTASVEAYVLSPPVAAIRVSFGTVFYPAHWTAAGLSTDGVETREKPLRKMFKGPVHKCL
ncbi:MAG: hypothetical protein ACE5E8_06120, partial [Acidimicrobiia bacterium]